MSKTANDGELVYGSGNVFRDFGRADADVQQTKALLAARIIGILDNDTGFRRARPRAAPVSTTRTSPAFATCCSLAASPLTG